MNCIKTSCLIALLVGSATFVGCTKETTSQEEQLADQPVELAEEKPGQSDFYYVESGNKPLAQVEEAIRRSNLIKSTTAYYYNFVDLNGDRNHEVLIYLRNGVETSGKLLIMSSDFKKTLGVFEAEMPIIVVNSKIKEDVWADLAVFKGKGLYLRHKMVDNVYQLSENSKENVIEFNEINGVGYLSDVNDKNGFIIQ